MTDYFVAIFHRFQFLDGNQEKGIALLDLWMTGHRLVSRYLPHKQRECLTLNLSILFRLFSLIHSSALTAAWKHSSLCGQDGSCCVVRLLKSDSRI